MKVLIWECTSLKISETDLEIYFVEHSLDAMMKRAPIGFLLHCICILGIQYMISSVIYFHFQ